MCNPMHVPRGELVLSVLRENCGKKHIDEWLTQVNENMPDQRRLTKNSFVHLILGIKELDIKKEKRHRNIYYEFSIPNETV